MEGDTLTQKECETSALLAKVNLLKLVGYTT